MENIHTQIDNPLLLRKQMLEAALVATETLRLRDNMKGFGEEKKIFRTQLKEMLKDMRKEMGAFTKIIPRLPEEFRAAMLESGVASFETLRPSRSNIEKDLLSIRKRLDELR